MPYRAGLFVVRGRAGRGAPGVRAAAPPALIGAGAQDTVGNGDDAGYCSRARSTDARRGPPAAPAADAATYADSVARFLEWRGRADRRGTACGDWH